MLPLVHSKVRETTISTGASNISLLGAVATCVAMSSRYAISESVPYYINHQSTDEFECGLGHLASATVFVRDTVHESSNADTFVSFSSGTKDVLVDITASMFNSLASLLSGTAVPTTEGSDGDYYIKHSGGIPNTIYGPKASGAWPAGVALTGAVGATGATGAAGTNGTNGADGAGVAAGGITYQVLQKISGADFDTGWVTLAGGGDALVANSLAQFALTTSAQLAGIMSDETGSGALVFSISPTLVTPILGTPASGNLLNCTFPTLNQNTSGTAGGLSGTALGGDVTNSANTITVVKINGVSMAGLATGILKNTTASGVPSIAVAGTDYVAPSGALGTPASGDLSNCTFPASLATDSGAETLTNKRITPRVSTLANDTTLDVDSDAFDIVVDTGLTGAVTCNNPTGTPTEGQVLIYKLTGTAARAITWGANFAASTVALPTTTVTTAMLTVGFMWDVASSKWVCVGAA